MSFYANLAATAKRLLAKFGQTVTLTRQSEGTYDPATGEVAPVITTIAAKAAIFAIAQKDIDGTLIKTGDQRAYIEAKIKPVTTDTLTDAAGTVYTVVDVKEIAPAGTAVLYEVVIRK